MGHPFKNAKALLWIHNSHAFFSVILNERSQRVFMNKEHPFDVQRFHEILGDCHLIRVQLLMVQSKESAGMLHYLSGGTWDPHDSNAIATTSESSVQFWDLRTMKKTDSIACSAYIRNVDYNPKRKHLLVTAEDETGISIWDLRKPKVPIQQLPGHTHWTCAVRCNPEYDGLILSAGTDSAVNLWLPSVSDSELKSERSVDSPPQQGDPLLHSYSDYEDSVYGLAWSFREPWIFASLSYDGRVVVESVKPFLSR